MITILNRQRKIPLDHAWVKRIVEKILTILDYQHFDVGILFTTNATIRRYNNQYRHKDKPTDILSFSYHPDVKPGKRILIKSDDDKNLGDLILSLEYIQKEAHKQGITLEEHLQILLIHGICHLLGYDHVTDADWHAMQLKEAYILKKLHKEDA